MADRIKLFVAFLIVAAGIVGFYYYDDQALLYRVLGLLAIILVAIGISMTTALGKSSWKFLQDSRTEVRKVVWPTRKETSQTTLLIMMSVVVVGIMLWALDTLLLWAVKLLTGQGS